MFTFYCPCLTHHKYIIGDAIQNRLFTFHDTILKHLTVRDENLNRIFKENYHLGLCTFDTAMPNVCRSNKW